MNMNPNLFFLYVRKSTDEKDRQVRSIQAQQFECRELAKQLGITIVREFEESRTAKEPGRPVFNEMLSLIEKGKAQGIIAWHPDRLARNSLDGGRIVYLLDTGKLQSLKCPGFWFENTPQGKLVLQMAFVQSKYYVDNLSENIKRGNRDKVRNGLWPGWAPLGYENDKTTKGIKPNETKAPLIRKAFQLYATGKYSLAQVREKVNALGMSGRLHKMKRKDGTPRILSVSNYQRLLQNPVYVGMFRFNGELHQGKHEPIVSKSLFDQVQEVFTRRMRPKTPDLKPFLFRGAFLCGECGCMITTETQKGHNYLRCTKRRQKCRQRYVREEAIEKQASTVISKVALNDLVADWLIAELESERANIANANQVIEQNLKAELAQCESKLDALLDMVLDKQITQQEYITKKEGFLGLKTTIQERITKLTTEKTGWFEPAIAFINEAKQAKILTNGENPERSRDFLQKVGSNLCITDKTLSLEFKNPWKTLVDFNSEPVPSCFVTVASGGKENWRRERDSNPR